jgi:hypothetical protein
MPHAVLGVAVLLTTASVAQAVAVVDAQLLTEDKDHHHLRSAVEAEVSTAV